MTASGTEILTAGIFEIQSFYGNIVFPLASVYQDCAPQDLRMTTFVLVLE